MINVEYRMLDGEYINGNSLDASFKKGDFLAKTNNGQKNDPEGMFRVANIIKRKMILKQIDCNSVHWAGDSRERMRGPDKNCKLKCEYFKRCPIRDYILLLKSGFE